MKTSLFGMIVKEESGFMRAIHRRHLRKGNVIFIHPDEKPMIEYYPGGEPPPAFVPGTPSAG